MHLQTLKDKNIFKDKFKTKTIKLRVKGIMMYMKAGPQKVQLGLQQLIIKRQIIKIKNYKIDL
jgi:hypothetical protein